MSFLAKKSCAICEKPLAKYSCPKCGIQYCSLACYRDQKHITCTESFYKQQVEESMQSQKADEQAKRQMKELMRRFREQIADDNLLDPDSLDSPADKEADKEDADKEEDVDDDDEHDLAERLQGIDLDGALNHQSAAEIWDRLTKAEKDGFLDMLGKQEIEEIIKPWTPWWGNKQGKRNNEPKIVELSDTENAADIDKSDAASSIPAILNIGVSVQTLAKKVHPSVIFQIIQIELAYAYMMRHVNGEPYNENLQLAFEVMTTVSPLLSSKTADIYPSAHEALVSGFCNIDIGLSSDAKIMLLGDLQAIFDAPIYVAATFSDIYSLLTELLALCKQPKTHETPTPKASIVHRAERRVYFILSVVLQMQNDISAWQFISADISLLKRRFESEFQASK
ncbi:hypothetical protein J3B02_001080 [Coemansia erecta]|uniref:HIT-type domain-containing protein n=1 Tax=Coemansia asiatica TaxID=1052880 RepID=A0A9W8CM48_9FUNG|nr:hypothetical protein LPJ64_001240 [Coemansia asiatica]KAJ2857320.1 hypothetical protein J3B02_001080 [Coemansia erecta]KAJ2888641.1 hypothetical protein FB639_000496 [Coemansia asiatica]